MATSDLINLSGLIDDAKCFALVRQHRWPEGACCPVCGRGAVIRDSHDDAHPYRNGAASPALVQSAGVPMLDDAALSAARTAHYPPPPPDIGDRLLRLLVWLEIRPG